MIIEYTGPMELSLILDGLTSLAYRVDNFFRFRARESICEAIVEAGVDSWCFREAK